MKNLLKSISLALILLFSMPLSNYANDTYTSQELQGKQEVLIIFDQIKDLRSKLNTIDINSINAKENYDELKKQIDSYLAEFRVIEDKLDKFEVEYAISSDDVLFANQLKFIISSYRLSLKEQLNLLDKLKAEHVEGTKLFFSQYLGNIYYYVGLGDQMLSYIDNHYNLK